MSKDLVRRLAVTVAAIACAIGTLFGMGVLGTPVEESAGGVLAADATLIAPAGTAFSIWSVIYAGLGGYVVWQWLPAQARSDRARATGWLAAASMVLNAAWLLVVQQGWLWLSVAVIVVLAVVLKMLVARLVRLPATGWADRVMVDGTFGLYLGWVAVATCANVAAVLVDTGISATGTAAEVAALAVLVAVLALAVVYARRFGRRWAVAAAMAWGVGWIAYGRLADAPESTVVGVTAAVVAVGIVCSVALPSPGPTGPRRRVQTTGA